MQASACKVLITVERLMTCQIPLLWKTGHRELVLVSANHIQPWTFVVSDDPMTRIFPRRWYDITGSRMIDIWKTALDAIVATVFFRPGIPEVRKFHFIINQVVCLITLERSGKSCEYIGLHTTYPRLTTY